MVLVHRSKHGLFVARLVALGLEFQSPTLRDLGDQVIPALVASRLVERLPDARAKWAIAVAEHKRRSRAAEAAVVAARVGKFARTYRKA